VITDENELVGESERSEASRQRDLRSFVDDTYIETALEEDWSEGVRAEGSGFASEGGRNEFQETHSLMPRAVVATILGRKSLLSISVSDFE
jgi:hypothetical protein